MQLKVLAKEFFIANQTMKSLKDDNLEFRNPCKP